MKEFDEELFRLLEEKVAFYNTVSFIKNDPVSIPHWFSKKEDIEISAFLTATLAWGQRKCIIARSRDLMELMDDSPYDFIVHASDNEKKRVGSFVYRTFQAVDCLYFIESLQDIYLTCGGLEQVFLEGYFPELSIKKAIGHFRSLFFSLPHLPRTEKHLSDPFSGSAAKRLNLFLRWMVRADNQGVDFGIWKNISPSKLLCPLDIHSGRVARKLGLLERTTDDWRAVEELTSNLRKFDATDPVKYDFALFGSGVHGNIPCF